ncbi:MAG: leucine-rich repeat domain-containing protein [Eubacteriales bacterium]|nr:leucine-rich repeat domain-containing protein [Eubacteriales bacterium]
MKKYKSVRLALCTAAMLAFSSVMGTNADVSYAAEAVKADDASTKATELIGGSAHSAKEYRFDLSKEEYNYRVFWSNDKIEFYTSPNTNTGIYNTVQEYEYSIEYHADLVENRSLIGAQDVGDNIPYILIYKESEQDPGYVAPNPVMPYTITIQKLYLPSEYRYIQYEIEENSDFALPKVDLQAIGNYNKVYYSEGTAEYELKLPRQFGYEFYYTGSGEGAYVEDNKLIVQPVSNTTYGDIEIKLTYQASRFLVKYDLNGGRMWENGPTEYEEYAQLNFYNMNEYTPIKEKAEFVGWEAEGHMITDISTLTPNDEEEYTLKAIWKEKTDGPEVTYFDEKGDCGAEQASSVTWGYNAQKKLLVISGNGAMADYAGGILSPSHAPWIAHRDEIEEIIVEEGVTSIGSHAFTECNVKKATLPKTVKKIESSAFSSCGYLTSVNIPTSVTVLKSSTFSGCGSLKTIKLPSKLTTIEDGVFDGCKKLSSISIPSTVTKIGEMAFLECKSLKSITLPKNLKTIGNQAFMSCTSLTTINIPSKVTTLDSTFENCTALTKITIPGNVTKLNHTFVGCKKLSEVTLKKGVKVLNGCFGNCTSLKKLTIPSTVTTMYTPVYGCKKLKTVTILSTKLTSKKLDATAFDGIKKGAVIKVPKSKLASYKKLFKKKGLASGVTIKAK